MKSGFSLMELLIVIGMMALLGSIAIGGYRAVVRGMEDRTAVSAASSIIRTASKRAQIDRKITAVKYWNETVADESETGNCVVQGKAVAIRWSGRITRKSGNLLIDEFGDLELSYPTNNVENASASSAERIMYFMPQYGKIESVAVKEGVQEETAPDVLLTSDGRSRDIRAFGFVAVGDASQVKVGTAYGMEFSSLTLPKGYIFGKDFSTKVDSPIRGEGVIVFDDRGEVCGGAKTLSICCLRPGEDGKLAAEEVGRTADPTKKVSD
jgi:prepilin-type N-terminal cleavage/methylation domain-containing protein